MTTGLATGTGDLSLSKFGADSGGKEALASSYVWIRMRLIGQAPNLRVHPDDILSCEKPFFNNLYSTTVRFRAGSSLSVFGEVKHVMLSGSKS